MQKQVSKQSLAIIALSILLAICMALTATYAAFSATNTTTGKITFVGGGLTITMSDQDKSHGITFDASDVAANGTNATLTITFEKEAFQLNGEKTAFVLTDDAKGVLAAYNVTITNTMPMAAVATAVYAVASPAAENVTITPVATSDNYQKSVAAKGENNVTVTYNIAEIISEISLSENINLATATDAFTITFEAHYL